MQRTTYGVGGVSASSQLATAASIRPSLHTKLDELPPARVMLQYVRVAHDHVQCLRTRQGHVEFLGYVVDIRGLAVARSIQRSDWVDAARGANESVSVR
jgi:hypothetical protein|eukprot:COSAG01_NODE_7678_length_3101_cov_3.712525_4_plen_99_part_00